MCEVEGRYDQRFNTVIFKASRDRAVLNKRSNIKWRQVASSGKPSVGIKGTCELMRLSYVDLPTICPPEPMHSQYLGTINHFIVFQLVYI